MDIGDATQQNLVDARHSVDGDGAMTLERNLPRKEDMPDLLRVDSSSTEAGSFRGEADGAADSDRRQSPSGPPGDSCPSDEPLSDSVKSASGQPMGNGPTTGDAKKKIPVESLSKEELILQMKRQMTLLQKMKTKHDELQKKVTELEQSPAPAVPQSDQETAVFRDKIASLEQDLKQERELHRKARDQAGKTSTNSVADLELRDYQRTIAQLNEKVTVKEECIQRVTEQLHASEQMLIKKHNTIHEQTEHIDDLTGKVAQLEGNLTEAHRENSDKARVISGLRDDVTGLQERIRALEGKLGSHSEEQTDLVRNFARLQELLEGKERLLQGKMAELARLTVDLAQARGLSDSVLRDFEEYKVRAQMLLKQKDNVVESGKRQKELDELVAKVAELDGELEMRRIQMEELEESLRKEKSTGEVGKRLFETEKVRWEKTVLDGEVRVRTLETTQESNYQDQRRKIKAYESEIASLKDLHGCTNEKLLEELRQLRLENETLRTTVSDLTSHSPVTHLDDPLNFSRSKSEDHLTNPRSRSGSADSSPPVSDLLTSSVFQRSTSVSASDTQRAPFDQLLQNSVATTSARDIDQRRLVHLSELLHESESSNVRLNEQIRVLKGELRRIEANMEREKHANSLEYLKNVLMQFLTHRVAAGEQEKLIEVMTTILQLTTEERQQLMKAASASYIPENVRAWGSYLNPWKAKEDG